MTTATVATPDEIDALQRDAEGQIVALEEQRARLAPAALVSAECKAELATVESEIDEARKAREVATLARQELDRREQQAVEDARNAEIETALGHARVLQGEREKAAKAVDATAAKFGQALAHYRDVVTSQAHQLGAAGRGEADLRRASYIPALPTEALRHALLMADAPHVEGLALYGRKDRPLAETDPKVGI